MGLVTLTFDLFTLKLVSESHLRRGTFLANLGTLGLCVLELFAIYATDGQTDGRTDGQKQRLLPPSLPNDSVVLFFFSFLSFFLILYGAPAMSLT